MKIGLVVTGLLLSVSGALAADPPCQTGMVVRAGALNRDAKILEFDAVKGFYRVRWETGVYKGDTEWLPPLDLKTCTALAIAPVAQSWFVGVWQLFTGGGGAYAQSRVTGSWKVIGLQVAGAPPIAIQADGSYEWVIDSKITVNGRWRLAVPTELKYGYEKRGTTILLERGEDGANWLVSRNLVSTSDGQDKILIERVDMGLSYRGSRIPGTKATAPPKATPIIAETAPVRQPQNPASTVRKTISLGNGALDYEASKWDAELSGGFYRLTHKSGKGVARFTALPEARSTRAAAEVATETMRQNILKWKLDQTGTQTARGVEKVVMRMSGAVHGVPYTYLVGVTGSSSGGLQVTANVATESYGGLEADFAALVAGLRLD